MAEKKNANAPAESKARGAKKKTTKDGNTVTKKRTEKVTAPKDVTVTAEYSEQDLFALVPDEDEAKRLTPINDINEAELARIEAEAIAALPRAEVEPELLLYDPEEIEDTHESPEEAARYEDYLRDYKEIMAELLKAAKETADEPHADAKNDIDAEDSDDEYDGDISEYVVTEESYEKDTDDELSSEEELISEEDLEAMEASVPLTDENFVGGTPIKAEAKDTDDESETDASEADPIEPDAGETADESETDAGEAKPIEPDAEVTADESETDASEAEPIEPDAKETADESETDAGETEPIEPDADCDFSAEETAVEAENCEDEPEDVANIGDETEELSTEVGFVEISKNRFDEDFDPLSTISLTEYVSSLRGEEEGEQLTLFENVENEDEEQYEAQKYESDDSGELFEEFGDAEQLEMHFGGENDGDADAVDKNKYDPERPRRVDKIFDLVEMLIFTFAAIIILTSFFFRHSVIDGSSMENTLHDRDVVIISDFLYTPKRGDIVVLDDRSAHDGAIVKRVIGIEGDRVTIERNGDIYVNGKKLSESYVFEDLPHSYKAKTWYVGEGEIFVLGDHRNVSDDSEDFGPVSVDSVLGKVLFRVWPFEVFGQVK